MIAGNIHNLELAMLPKSLLKILTEYGLDFAKLQSLDNGRYQLEGEAWFYMISSPITEPVEQRKPEFHKNYLDIQLVLEGEELIGYGLVDVSNHAATEDAPDLFMLSATKVCNFINLQPGDFAVFYPHEAHQPQCTVNEPMKVKKAVFKVPISMLK